MKAYREYRQAGLPWVRQVPKHWDALPNIALFSERVERGFSDAELLAVSIKRGITKQAELEDDRDSSNEDKSAYKRVCVGDIAYNKMRMWQGAVGVSQSEGIVSPAYIVVKPKHRLNPKFYHYLFRSSLYTTYSYRNSYGICDDQLSLRYFNFKRMLTVVPPIEEQDAIVAFLESKEQDIAAFITNKHRMIELLREQETVLVNHTITRGLETQRPTKPSGSRFWGRIPRHWRFVPLHRITDPQRKIMYGIVLPGPDVDDGVFIVKGGNCEPGRLSKEFLSKTTREIEAGYVRSRLKSNDIVYAIRGSIGAAELVPPEIEGANLTQDAARVAPGQGIHPRWLLYAVRSQAFFGKLDSEATGATIRGINICDLKRGEIAVPPLDEQVRIADLLDRQMAQIQESLTTCEREIELMEEYRTALIAATVTGRIDVRNN